jgi:hypothetical protein
LALLTTLGAGHFILIAILRGPTMLGWLRQGLWAAVPLKVGAQPGVEALQNLVVFWASVGSFAIPSILLGALQWTLAGRGVADAAAGASDKRDGISEFQRHFAPFV